jgi:hypothetical protein
MRQLPHHFSHANVTATVALVFAIGGTAPAVATLLRNSRSARSSYDPTP